MIKAATLSTDVNLLPLSTILSRQGIRHQINEESGQQVIWVASEAEADLVRSAIAQYQDQGFGQENGSAEWTRSQQGQEDWRIGGRNFTLRLASEFRQAPVTLTLITCCLLIALVSQLGLAAGNVRVLFYPLISSDNVFALLGSIDSPVTFLRTLGPMFLHFSVLHIVFNLLWLWYFGRQLETYYPSWLFLLVVLLTSFVANTTQYLVSGYNNFGGMSGVVYGLVAYFWVLHSLLPRSRLLFNNSMFTIFVVALVVMEVFAGSWIATAAHLGGLVSGLVIGLVAVGYYRTVKN